MSEDVPSGEPQKSYPDEIVELLQRLAEQGVDFTEADLPHLQGMDEEELQGYFYQALLEAGVEEPEVFMAEHNLIEGFRKYTEAEIGERTGEYLGDEVDERDRQRGAGSYPREVE